MFIVTHFAETMDIDNNALECGFGIFKRQKDTVSVHTHVPHVTNQSAEFMAHFARAEARLWHTIASEISVDQDQPDQVHQDAATEKVRRRRDVAIFGEVLSERGYTGNGLCTRADG